MRATHTLDMKIQALNLLDRHDGDFNLVESRLGIPLKTLRGWLSDEKNLRLRFDDRQYRHFANMKLQLLNDILEFSRVTMNKMKIGDLGGNTLSQLTYVLSTMLNQARDLEKSFKDLEANPQREAEQPNLIRQVCDEDLQTALLQIDATPVQPSPTQSSALRAALEKSLETGTDQDPDTGALAPEALLLGGAEMPDAGLDLAQSGNGPQKLMRRPKAMPRQPVRKRRNRRKKRK